MGLASFSGRTDSRRAVPGSSSPWPTPTRALAASHPRVPERLIFPRTEGRATRPGTFPDSTDCPTKRAILFASAEYSFVIIRRFRFERQATLVRPDGRAVLGQAAQPPYRTRA